MELTRENYFSPEANKKYMSVSRFKNYISCEAMAKAIDEGKFTPEQTDSMLQGSYIDAWNNGELEEFKQNEGYKLISSRGATKGELKAEFKKIGDCIATLEEDELCMEYLKGEKQKIFTAELFGIPWKIAVDNHYPEKGRFTDLKCMQNFEWSYSPLEQRRVSFVEAWNYHLQMAIYRKVIALATGEYLEPLIVAVTKQDIPDKAIITFEQLELQEQLNRVEEHLDRIMAVIDGDIEPHRCGKCKYCRMTKKLTLQDIKHHYNI